jgi:hypothetical protein
VLLVLLCLSLSLSQQLLIFFHYFLQSCTLLSRTHAHRHTGTHACVHARMHARTHARTYTHTRTMEERKMRESPVPEC